MPVETESYGKGLQADVGLSGAALGTFLHQCFEVLGDRPELAPRIPELTGITLTSEALAPIETAVRRFESWLAATYQPEQILREWPLMMLADDGSVISGTADLIVHTAEGAWILDHKSDRIEDPTEAYQKYRPQLGAYVDALASQGTKVLGVGIHWIRLGVVTFGPIDDPAARSRVRSGPSETLAP